MKTSESQNSSRAKRSTVLIAEFEGGFAKNWFMAVGECFRDSLDIKYTQRVKDKVATNVWTQGPYFSFSEGNIIYDKPVCGMDWRGTLGIIKYLIKVTEATPNIRSFEVTTDGTREIKEGYVKFVIYKPNQEKTGLASLGDFELSQNDFVQLLKTGKMNGRCLDEHTD